MRWVLTFYLGKDYEWTCISADPAAHDGNASDNGEASEGAEAQMLFLSPHHFGWPCARQRSFMALLLHLRLSGQSCLSVRLYRSTVVFAAAVLISLLSFCDRQCHYQVGYLIEIF